MRKRIIALILTFVTFISIFTVPASASEHPGIDTLVDFVDWGIKGSGLYNVLKGFFPNDTTPETATNEDWKNAYTQYNTTINNNYGSSTFGSDGALYIPVRFRSTFGNESFFQVLGATYSYPQTFIAKNISTESVSFMVYIDDDNFVAPINGRYSFVQSSPVIYRNGTQLPPNMSQNNYGFALKRLSAGAKIFTSYGFVSQSAAVNDVLRFEIPWLRQAWP